MKLLEKQSRYVVVLSYLDFLSYCKTVLYKEMVSLSRKKYLTNSRCAFMDCL